MNTKLAVLLTVVVVAGSLFAVHEYVQHIKKDQTNQQDANILAAFQDFKKTYNKNYGNLLGAEEYRQRVFSANYKMVEAHNKAGHSYTMKLNQFSDITAAEFKSQYLGVHSEKLNKNVTILPEDNLADSVDWRNKGAVTPVKNQGQCGSCWSFSTTGGLEGMVGVAGNLQSFSEQQLVDCSGSYGNQGCNGGLMDNAFQYIRDHGIVHESEYKYTAEQGTCKQNSGPQKLSEYHDVAAGNVKQLEAAVNQQPVSIAVDAQSWQFYSGGVFSNCGSSLDHGVLLVGYTSEQWIVKNSWGESWGLDGYIHLERGNTCGLANSASYPTA